MYDNSNNSEKLSVEILCEMLDFLKFKIRNKRLNVSEMQALHQLFEGIEITGTAEDFAKFYNQNPVNVRCVICRKYIGKPHRAVLYSFNRFRRIIPSSWESGRCSDEADGQRHASVE